MATPTPTRRIQGQKSLLAISSRRQTFRKFRSFSATTTGEKIPCPPMDMKVPGSLGHLKMPLLLDMTCIPGRIPRRLSETRTARSVPHQIARLCASAQLVGPRQTSSRPSLGPVDGELRLTLASRKCSTSAGSALQPCHHPQRPPSWSEVSSGCGGATLPRVHGAQAPAARVNDCHRLPTRVCSERQAKSQHLQQSV